MFDSKKHIVHLANGKLGNGRSTAEEINALVAAAFKENKPGGLVINFHGGLVSEKSARETAEKRLYTHFLNDAGAYPVFFVWESGFFESPINNLNEIVKEDLFQEFVKKVSEWVLKKFGNAVGLKGAAGGLIDEAELRREFDEWFQGNKDNPPITSDGNQEIDGIKSRDASDLPDENALAAEIDDGLDDDFKTAVEGVALGLTPATPGESRSAGVTVAVNSLISKEAATELLEDQQGTKGVVAWFKVAKVVAKIVIRVIRRLRSGRDHGAYVTVVEEVLRELYIDKIGRHVWWDRMKADTSDAFGNGDEYGGTVLLRALKNEFANGGTLPAITLVGHSTGAIYICNFLRAAALHIPDQKFNVIFQAPAVTYTLFADAIREHGSRIANFRQFAMSDASETKDVLVPILYTRSLLYFVSGLLEPQVDEPLVGMERYLTDGKTYPIDDYPNIEVCKRFFEKHQKSLVWAPSSAGNGLNSMGAKHGAFDDADPEGMASVVHIFKHGY